MWVCRAPVLIHHLKVRIVEEEATINPRLSDLRRTTAAIHEAGLLVAAPDALPNVASAGEVTNVLPGPGGPEVPRVLPVLAVLRDQEDGSRSK
jgi:hypothetical protein